MCCESTYGRIQKVGTLFILYPHKLKVHHPTKSWGKPSALAPTKHTITIVNTSPSHDKQATSITWNNYNILANMKFLS